MSPPGDPYALHRFVEAQDRHDLYLDATYELRAGLKERHWMWFVFPQVAGLGRTPTSKLFAISGLPEAVAYLAHPVLGPRLVECARILIELPGNDPLDIFDSVDAQKLHSAMTLFARAAPHGQVFRDVLEKYFGAAEDAATIALL